MSKFEEGNDGWNCIVSSGLSVIGGPVFYEVEMPRGGGIVCSTRPGSLLELTIVSGFETGSKSGSKADSTG